MSWTFRRENRRRAAVTDATIWRVISPPARKEPPTTADERAMLEGWLDYHRATLLTKCAGLTDEQLCMRSVEPSALSLIGLLRHLTICEYGWFEKIYAGAPARELYSSPDDVDYEINAVDDATGNEAHTEFTKACALSRQLVEGRSLDEVVDYSPDGGSTVDRFSLRWIMTHMIEEYARHNGHADFLRERIDGAVGD
jgi:uncharacterized damage-inducible protein DinB